MLTEPYLVVMMWWVCARFPPKLSWERTALQTSRSVKKRGGGTPGTGPNSSPCRESSDKVWWTFLRFGSISHYSILIGLIINWTNFSPYWVCFAHDTNWWVISPHSYFDPRAFHYIFCPLFSWEGRTERLWGILHIKAGSTHHNGAIQMQNFSGYQALSGSPL